jgi:hypothetical protein
MQNKIQLIVLLALAGFGIGLANERYGWVDLQNQTAALQNRFTVCDVPPPAEKQIVNLPEDGTAYHTSLWLPANWQADAKSRELVAWFETNNKLKSLKAQTHWHVYTTDQAWYQQRYRNMVPTVPAVTVQKPSGQFVYEAGIKNPIPNSAPALAADIQGNLYSNCPNRRPKPEPSPEPDEPVVDKNGPPKLIDGGETPAFDPPLLLAVIGLLAGAGLGIGSKYYEQYYKTV